MEQVLDWLNENELRAYPLLDNCDKTFIVGDNSWTLPENFLLDLQLIIKTFSLDELTTLTSGNMALTSRPIFLSRLTADSQANVSVTFSSDVDNTIVDVTTFVIAYATSQIYPLYIRNADGCLAVFGVGVHDFAAAAAPHNTDVSVSFFVEPTTSSQFNDAWLGVNSIRTQPEKASLYVDSPEPGIAYSYEPVLPLQAVVTPVRLSGDVKLLEGYNFRVNIRNNLIDLEIGADYGLKMNCYKHFIEPKYRDCHEIVSFINGVPPDEYGNFRLVAGSNISIVSGNAISAFDDNIRESLHPEYHEKANEHTLFVGLTFQKTDLCPPITITPSLI